MKTGDFASESWERRAHRLIDRIVDVNADIFCLQELEGRECFNYLAHHLAKRGYYGVYSNRNNEEPEGLATFYRYADFSLEKLDDFYFDDQTGRLATLSRVRSHDGIWDINVVNTHLIWGEGQLSEAINVNRFVHRQSGCVVLCGDFNCLKESEEFRALQTGLHDLGQNSPPTFLEEGTPVRYDGILYNQPRKLRPEWCYTVGEISETKTSEPSDHLPLVLEFAQPPPATFSSLN